MARKKEEVKTQAKTAAPKSEDKPQGSFYQLLAGKLNEKFGAGFVETVDSDAPIDGVDTWLQMPDWWHEFSGVQGVPAGRIVVIQGLPDSAKTSIAMDAMKRAQEQEWVVCLIDSEFKFNMGRFTQIGGDRSKLLKAEAETVEEVFRKFESLSDFVYELDKNAKVLFVWDSLGMTPTEAETDNPDSNAPAVAARVIKRNIRRLLSKIHDKDVAFLIVNHMYANMASRFGESYTGYGGKGVYYAASLVIETKIIGRIARQRDGKKFDYPRIQMKLRKNHLSPAQGATFVINVLPTGLEVKGAKHDPLSLDEGETIVGAGDLEDLPKYGGAVQDELSLE